MNEDLQKQQYLQESIIKQGLSPTQFQSFLENIKPNQSENIDAWTLNELEDAVQQFMSVEEIDLAEPQKQVIQEDNNQPKQEFYKLLNCQKLKKSLIGATDGIQIRVEGYEKVPAGFFSAGYTVFRIITTPMQWKVCRKYGDFIQLREILCRLNPGLALLVVPEIKASKKQTDNMFSKQQDFCQVDNNKQIQQRFIGYVLDIDEMANTQIFEQFLCLSTDKDWQNAVKVSMKDEKIKRLDQVVTLEGNLELKINQEINEYFDQSEKYLDDVTVILKKSRKVAKQLVVDLDKVSKTMLEMSRLFSQLNNSSINFNQPLNSIYYQKNKPQEPLILEDISNTLSSMMKRWSSIIHEQIGLIEHSFNRTFKFHQYQTHQLQELIKQRDLAEKDYIQFQQKLLQKKDKIFSQGNILRWDLPEKILDSHSKQDLIINRQLVYQYMLPKETFQSRELRDIFGFYNYRAYHQIQSVMNKTSLQLNQDLLEFSKVESLRIPTLHELWADSITSFKSIQIHQQQN